MTLRQVRIDESQSKEDTLTYRLAPSFRTLEKNSFQKMDDNLKIMITATIRAIESIKEEDRSWETVYSTLLQNSVLEPLGDEIVKVDRLERDGYTWFKFRDTPEKFVLDAVNVFLQSALERALTDSARLMIGSLSCSRTRTYVTLHQSTFRVSQKWWPLPARGWNISFRWRRSPKISRGGKMW